ncbi:hypothetical protein PIB30_041053 [Stylosanthes scabra]|uniref:Uncharacterized protein n=1 Tax=Stylosanthes scabra TaxID=79078 RepID=A0ABU6UDG7_9FABA|nr:hypothetical protein [Stylosanthes scabra]
MPLWCQVGSSLELGPNLTLVSLWAAIKFGLRMWHRGATKFENTKYWTRVILPRKQKLRGVALMVLKLTPFLPSIALRDQQLRSPAHFNPYPSHYGHYSLWTEIIHWCVCTGAFGAYALAPISTLGVPPKAIGAHALTLGCVRIGSKNGLLHFVCNLLVPLALFSHFRSELCLLKPETLERTHQGIVRNRKRFKTQ